VANKQIAKNNRRRQWATVSQVNFMKSCAS